MANSNFFALKKFKVSGSMLYAFVASLSLLVSTEPYDIILFCQDQDKKAQMNLC